MDSLQPSESWLVILSHYVAWLITSVIAIIDALAIREAILAILALYSVVENNAYHRAGGVGQNLLTSFGISAFDSFMLLILGCGAITFVIWVEYYFRKGRPKGLLFKRIGKVVAVEVGIVIVALIIQQVIALFI